MSVPWAQVLAFVGVVGIVGGGAVALARVEHLLWARSDAQQRRFLLAVVLTVPLAGLLGAWVALSDPGPGRLAVVGAGLVCGHVVLIAALAPVDPRRMARTGFAALALAALVVALWPTSGALPGDLIWGNADQHRYYVQARGLLQGQLSGSQPPGLPLLLSPLVLVSGTLAPGAGELRGPQAATTLLNAVALVPFLAVSALAVDSVARAGIRLAGFFKTSGLRTHALAVGLTVAVAGLYLHIPPDVVSERVTALVPRRWTGLVYSYEAFAMGAMAALAAGLVRVRGLIGVAEIPVLAGFVGGLALLMREPLLAPVAVVATMLAVLPGCRWAAVKFAVPVAVLVLYGRAYAELGRSRADAYRGERWREIAVERYGWSASEPPPQMSLTYLPANLSATLPAVWWLLVLVIVGGLVALASTRGRAWTSAGAWAVIVTWVLTSLVLHAMWVNAEATFRYNTALIGPAALAAIVIALCGTRVVEGWQRKPIDRPTDVSSVAPASPDKVRMTGPGAWSGSFANHWLSYRCPPA
jgi:hypothetical protein